MKREQQIKTSKEMILNSLLKLMKEKPIDSITMTEISDAADVTRMTLYRHFKSKEDIILYGFDKNVDELVIKINQKSQPTIYDMLLFRFKALKQSPYSVILVENNYMQKLFRIVRRKTVDKFEKASMFSKNQLTLDFIGGGIDAITEKWIREGMTTPYEEMAEKVYHLVRKVLES